MLAAEHRETEQALVESGLPVVLLRNGWYTENYTLPLPSALREGVIRGAAGDGRISTAARADYAEAAAAVLADGDHAGRTYELAGSGAFTMQQLASVVSRASGRFVSYQDMSPDALEAASLQAGLPNGYTQLLANTDAGIAKGALYDDGGDLARLIGRFTTPFEETIATFVESYEAGARNGDEPGAHS